MKQKIKSNRRGFVLPIVILGLALVTVLISAYMKGSFNNLFYSEAARENISSRKSLDSMASIFRSSLVGFVRVFLNVSGEHELTDEVLDSQLVSNVLNSHFDLNEQRKMQVQLKCLYEGREDAHMDEEFWDRSPCTNQPIFPKIFSLKLRYRAENNTILELSSIEKISPERLLDYAYLITNETRDEVTIGAGEFNGQFGVIFVNPSDDTKVRFAPDENETLTFQDLFVTNLSQDLSSDYFAYGFGPNQMNPPYGRVSMERGVARFDSVPDIKGNFENLRESAVKISDDSDTPVSAKILLGGESNDCKAQITERIERMSCGGGMCQIHRFNQTLDLTNDELAENTTYLVRGPTVTVSSFNPSSSYASVCANKVTFLTDGNVNLEKSILRKQAGGDPAEESDATAALVSLNGSININGSFETLQGGSLDDRIQAERSGNGDIPSDQVTAALEISLVAPSLDQSALKINPELIDPSESVGLGILKTNGIIATGSVSPTKTYMGNGSEVVGFDKVDLSYNQAIFDNPPPGLDESITGLPLAITTDRSSFRVLSFQEALQAMRN